MTLTLGNLLPLAADRFGAKPVLVIEDQTFSFRQLDELSNQAANGLVATGVRPGDRVTLYGPNCWEWIVAYYAIAKAGAVVNPINVMLTPDEVRYVVEDSGARAVIASADKGGPLLDMKGRTANLSEVILWGESPPRGATGFTDWLALGKPSFDAVARQSGDAAAICYTSGTTGHPKGAMQSHRSVVAATAGTALMAARTASDRIVTALPMPHVYGQCVLNSTVMTGATLILLPRFTEVATLTAISQHRATILDGVPTVYYYLLAHPDFDRYDLSSLTRGWVGGQTMPAAKSEEFLRRTNCPVYEIWGMTELAGPASANPVYGENKVGTVGIPYPGNQMRIVDTTDASKILGPGEVGEVMFRGPMVMDGYFGNETATRETIEPDGWLHSGDIGTMDEDGYVSIVDRKKDMVLTGGYNIYPAELERVLCMHPAVAIAAVAAVPDEARGELAKAYLVLRQNSAASPEEILTFCRQHLAAYKVPRAVQFVTAMPTTSSGKIMRRMLKEIDDGAR
jgi:long-chain acyl-CoA synthetase